MACTASFNRDHRRCQLLEEGHHFLAPQLLTKNRHLGGIDPVKLENVFRRIHSNAANLVHGRSPLSEICNDLILAHTMPSGAVHPNNSHVTSRQTGQSRGSLTFLSRSKRPYGLT